jgi:hypothetical protein
MDKDDQFQNEEKDQVVDDLLPPDERKVKYI